MRHCDAPGPIRHLDRSKINVLVLAWNVLQCITMKTTQKRKIEALLAETGIEVATLHLDREDSDDDVGTATLRFGRITADGFFLQSGLGVRMGTYEENDNEYRDLQAEIEEVLAGRARLLVTD